MLDFGGLGLPRQHSGIDEGLFGAGEWEVLKREQVIGYDSNRPNVYLFVQLSSLLLLDYLGSFVERGPERNSHQLWLLFVFCSIFELRDNYGGSRLAVSLRFTDKYVVYLQITMHYALLVQGGHSEHDLFNNVCALELTHATHLLQKLLNALVVHIFKDDISVALPIEYQANLVQVWMINLA